MFRIVAKRRITIINQLARTILNCHDADLIGRRIDETGAMDATLIACLEGKQCSRIRRSVSMEKGHFEFFTSARQVIDSTERIIGAVKEGNTLTRRLDALERRIVVSTLKSARSIRQVAGRLGISHTTLRNKKKKHRLWADHFCRLTFNPVSTSGRSSFLYLHFPVCCRLRKPVPIEGRSAHHRPKATTPHRVPPR